MLVLKCLKALGAMLFALFACIVFERKTFLLLTVVIALEIKPQFEYQLCIFRFSMLFFIHSLWYSLKEFVQTSRHSIIGDDHFLHSHDWYV